MIRPTGPLRRVSPVDGTGAGDVFAAMCAYGLAPEWDPDHMLDMAAAAGALPGRARTRNGVPTLAEHRHPGQPGGSTMIDLDSIDRLELAVLPTPVQFCRRLTEHLGGPRIFVKRDDLTGAGGGGNKVRKLEYVLAEAVAAGADSVVSIGVTQSNAMRQLAGTAAALGLACHCAVITDRFGIDSPDYREGGNYFLTRLFGAAVHPCTASDDQTGVLERIAAGLRSEGMRPFVIPYGISSVSGALGYVRAVREVADQMAGPDGHHPCAAVRPGRRPAPW